MATGELWKLLDYRQFFLISYICLSLVVDFFPFSLTCFFFFLYTLVFVPSCTLGTCSRCICSFFPPSDHLYSTMTPLLFAAFSVSLYQVQ